MKISQVLKLAKEKLPTERFVCIAIRESGAGLISKEYATQYVRNLLEGCFTVEQWLQDKAGIDANSMTYEGMNDYRLRWVDHMINELEKESM